MTGTKVFLFYLSLVSADPGFRRVSFKFASFPSLNVFDQLLDAFTRDVLG